ncbi:protein Niban 1-like isoform X3 [Centroberyx gerrardi]|uniref:protein Niban 1-like isoform X3 n=1 Tax=Centroberyx gerrardi TaxID=166262 RepID=UPI003AAE38C2
MGNEEEVLVSMVMEEVMSYLREQVFPRTAAHHNRSTQAWIRLLSEVYREACQQVKAAVAVLKEELSLCHSDLEKQISAGQQQASLLQENIAHTITEDMCGLMLQSLLHVIIPRLDRTLQEVATPICDGFASTRQYFLETCDNIIDQGSKGRSMKEVLRPLSGLGPDDTRMWQCLARLEMSSEGRAWLQEAWGVHTGAWRPLALKAQNALYKVVDMCAVMFRRLVSRYPCCSLDRSQLGAVLCRVRDRVVKDLSRYDAMVTSDQAVFIHSDIIFHCILRDSMACHIQSVMRYSLPQQCVPLPASPSNLSSCSSDFSEFVCQDLLPPGDRQQNLCQTSEGSASGSDTLTPSTLSEQDAPLCLAVVKEPVTKENHAPTLLDAGEYIHLTES